MDILVPLKTFYFPVYQKRLKSTDKLTFLSPVFSPSGQGGGSDSGFFLAKRDEGHYHSSHDSPRQKFIMALTDTAGR
jgi:hypothetical protein